MTVTSAPLATQDLPLDRLLPHPANRKQFDPKQLEELAESLKSQGLLNAIITRPHPSKAGHYEIIAGDRRCRAARLAKWTVITGQVRELDDHEALKLVVIDNLQRTNPTPLEEADGYKALEDDGMTIPEIATAVAKDPAYVHRRLQLRHLVPEARKRFEAGGLSLAVALQLARLASGIQKDALEAHWATNSEKSFRDWLRNNILVELKRAPFDTKDATLLPSAGACTTCPKRTGMSPTLFGDIDGKDICTDPRCFVSKEGALVQLRRKEQVDAGAKPVFITTEYYSRGRDDQLAGKGAKVLGTSEYSKAKAGDPKAVPAIVVGGEGVGKVIHVTVGAPARSTSPSSSGDRAHREAVKKAKHETHVRSALFMAARAAIAKLPVAKVLALDPLRQIVTAYAHESLHYETAQVGVEVLGLRPEGKKAPRTHDERDLIQEFVTGTKDPANLARLAILLPRLGELKASTHGRSGTPPELLALCKSVGVNAKAIETKLRAEYRAAAKAKLGQGKKRAGDVARTKQAKKAVSKGGK
jgi:ParB/RepB/Spo0J family partition protein